ncbi:NifU family protein [soil metagenome]
MSAEADDTISQHDLLADIDMLIQRLENHADPEVRAQVSALLAGIDAVHRGALTRMLEGIRAMAGDAFLNRLIGDPVIRLLLMSYDLIAVDRRIQTEDALDLVRPHLQSHGIRVELVDVVGGVIRVRLHGLDAAAASEPAVRADLEAALREGLIGFQELEIGDAAPADVPQPLVSLGPYRALRRPVHREAVDAAELAPGTMHAAELDGQPVLIVNVGGDFHAVANRCGDSPLPLHFGVLEGAVIRCSWHGCRYDVRTGRRVDGGAERLRVYPLRLERGVVLVTVDVQPAGYGAP